MMFTKKIWWLGLRACLYCGSLDRQSDGLCEICSEDLWYWQPKEEGLYTRNMDKFIVRSLFHWVPGKQEVLSRLLRAMKGEGAEDLWKFYAEEFWARNLQSHETTLVKPLLLIPSPSKSGLRDHAVCFTQSLVESCGATYYPCLQRASTGSQKKKRRSDRFKATLAWNERFTQTEFKRVSAGKQIVFVDDVVTTGATAKAAWKTLGKPRDFAVWALAQRGQSCGVSRDLI